MNQALSLSQLNRMVAAALSQPSLVNVWVVAELSDVRVKGGHCYMELLEKDANTGNAVAKLKAVVWAGNFVRINADFMAATGRRIESGLKVMVRGSINYHSAFGLSFVISAIDVSYTMGEAERRRREILERLKAEGVIGMNRDLEWPLMPQRIAVISARGAAGFGDFMHQLATNPMRLRFKVKLFEALMQGQHTSTSVIEALGDIYNDDQDWDCVVIIRGGGSTSDLSSFDDYDLASAVAQFPLPVVVGIGHERDVTVLDYVGNMRVKTPTAAAEWLIARGESLLNSLRRAGADILQAVSDKMSGAHTQLAYIESGIQQAPGMAMQRAASRLSQAGLTISGLATRRIIPLQERLAHAEIMIGQAIENAIGKQREKLDGKMRLVAALSPKATLQRGYSLTMSNGRIIKSVNDVATGDKLVTMLADGQITSTI